MISVAFDLSQFHASATRVLVLLVSRRRITVLLDPVNKAFPFVLVLLEPLVNNLVVASDFEYPFQDHFHPQVVVLVLRYNFTHEGRELLAEVNLVPLTGGRTQDILKQE